MEKSRLHKNPVVGYKVIIKQFFSSVSIILWLMVGLLVFGGCNQHAPALQGQVEFNAFLLNTIQFVCLALIVYYLVVLNPAKVRQEVQSKFVSELKKNDEVLTSSGFWGRVVSVADDFITVDLGNGVKVKVQPKHLRPVPEKKPASSPASKSEQDGGVKEKKKKG